MGHTVVSMPPPAIIPMPNRASPIAALTAVFSFALLIFLLFYSNPAPPNSLVSNRPPLAWNGYSPLVRITHMLPTPSSTASPRPTPIQKRSQQPPTLLSRLLSWFSKPFLHRFSTAPPPNLPHTFLTATIAGVPIAHHNPFPPHRLAGVAVLFHACRQSAADWFTLPEHRRLAAELLRHRLALLAVSSANRGTGCWSTRHPAMLNHDAARVRLAVRQWLDAHRVSHAAPVYAIGISSGATFLTVATAAHYIPSLVAQALYLSAGNQRALRNASDDYPNTLFVRLQSDRFYATAPAVTVARSTLLSRRVPLVAELPLPPEKWTPDSLHVHEPRISRQASAAIYAHLTMCAHQIECATLHAAAHNASVAAVYRQPHLMRALTQVGRVLHGDHEMSAAHANLVADWLVQHARNPQAQPQTRRLSRRFAKRRSL